MPLNTKNSLDKIIQIDKEMRSFGFTWSSPKDVLSKIMDEYEEVCVEVEKAQSQDNRAQLESELGDLLHSVLALCLYLKSDPHSILDKACLKLESRLSQLKNMCAKKGLTDLKACDQKVMLHLWQQVKQAEQESVVTE